MGSVETDLSPREKAAALARVARFRPVATAGIMALSVIAAVLEGIGLGFILPIIEQVQAGGPPSDPDGVLGTFVTVYATLGVPFTLGFLVAGVTAVMAVRFTASFLADWLRAWLRTRYVRHLQVQAFGNAMDASVAYFDREGSDDILNAIVTQAEYAGRVIDKSVRIVMEGFLAAIYLGIAVFLAPLLTLAAAALLGGVMFLFRFVIEPGYVVGDRVADANERIQRAAQAGTQGIRDVKAFGLAAEIERNFVDAVDRFTRSRVTLERNEAAIHSFYELVAATAVFLLIYAALTFADLTLASLGVFLFAIFRLAPQVSRLNNLLYGLEGDLPHLVRTHEFIDDLSASHETSGGDATPPQPVEQLAFDDVTFAYERADDEALDGVSFEVERGEFVGFVGPSGAGKSTIAALIARLYDPDAGTVSADGTPLSAFDVDEWRDRVALVRQRPFLFDRSLRYNLTIGARDATDDEIDRVCEVARVDEFLAGLPDGLDTVIGDDGVTLSGGQRQRVALARALLTDASILVLDEATSDLDTALESEVHDAIEARSGDRLVVAIAHRLSTVADADRIYGVDDGEIVESGTHAELVARDGLYADLHERQHNAVPGTSDGHSGTEHPDGSG